MSATKMSAAATSPFETVTFESKENVRVDLANIKGEPTSKYVRGTLTRPYTTKSNRDIVIGSDAILVKFEYPTLHDMQEIGESYRIPKRYIYKVSLTR